MERSPMPHRQDDRQEDRAENNQTISRRIFLKQMRWAPALFLPAPVIGPPLRSGLLSGPLSGLRSGPQRISAAYSSNFPFADIRFTPHYPANSALDAVLRLAARGSDDYVTD